MSSEPTSAESIPVESICEVNIDTLISELTSGAGPQKLPTSMLIQLGVWAELRTIRTLMELTESRRFKRQRRAARALDRGVPQNHRRRKTLAT
jgi:hypothetical protein